MTSLRSFTTYTLALTIVVAQLLCGCMTSFGSQTVTSVASASLADSSSTAMPCHGAGSDEPASNSPSDNSHDCTHCATASALVADAFTAGTLLVADLPHWSPAPIVIDGRTPPTAVVASVRPLGWRAPYQSDTLVSHRILLLI